MKEYDPLKPERERRTLTEEERARFAEALRRAVKKPPAMASKAAAEDGDLHHSPPSSKETALDEAELLEMVCETEGESTECGLGVAPWPYERLAVLYRKQKRHAEEIAILERFSKQQHAPGVKPARLLQRLGEAKARKPID